LARALTTAGSDEAVFCPRRKTFSLEVQAQFSFDFSNGMVCTQILLNTRLCDTTGEQGEERGGTRQMSLITTMAASAI
jgi:hypothetical protein